MTTVPELRLLLDAKQEADVKYKLRPYLAQHSVKAEADQAYYAALTNDTIAALLDGMESARLFDQWAQFIIEQCQSTGQPQTLTEAVRGVEHVRTRYAAALARLEASDVRE